MNRIDKEATQRLADQISVMDRAEEFGPILHSLVVSTGEDNKVDGTALYPLVSRLGVRAVVDFLLGLRFIGTAEDGPLFVRLMNDESEDIRVRTACLELVGHHQIQSASPSLLTLLRHDRAEIRYWAIDALYWLATANAEDEIRRLQSDEEIGWAGETVGSRARQALKRLAEDRKEERPRF